MLRTGIKKVEDLKHWLARELDMVGGWEGVKAFVRDS
jgi:hypothetical protein